MCDSGCNRQQENCIPEHTTIAMEDQLTETMPMISRQQAVVNQGEDDEMVIHGYIRSGWRTALTWFFIIISAGLLRLVFYWKPNWFIRCTHVQTGVEEATHVLLKDQYNQEFVERVRCMNVSGQEDTKLFGDGHDKTEEPTALSMVKRDSNTLFRSQESDEPPRYFINKKLKYLLVDGVYEKLGGAEKGARCSQIHNMKPLSSDQAAKRLMLYGRNVLEVHVTRVVVLVVRQIMNPFYVFQLFSCLLWYTDHYYYYATAILLISILSITVTTYSTRQMERALKHTVHQFGSATVQREEGTVTMLPTDLVPGDLIHIPRTGFIMDVDAILLTGNCIVNESMLTGESIPVTKTPLPNSTTNDMLYDPKVHAKHTLFCGTNVIQTRFYGDQPVTALVIRTGFMTAKGGLLRSIMFPKPVDFKFYKDTYMFMLSLAAVAFLGMIYTLVLMIQRQSEVGLVIRRVLDLLTIAVPPALPAALSVGIVISQQRLKKREQIYCIMPSYINIAGSINVVCFDKTGTLTEDGLDMHGSLPCEGDGFTELVKDTEGMVDSAPIKAAMASCHSLTYINGELSGDPLDLIMFEATGWSLVEVGEEANRYDIIMPTVVKPKGVTSSDGPEVGILRQFTFSSSLQRMSVIVKNLSNPSFELYAKGSPEIISSLCKPESLPADFATRLAEYTQHGYRVIALAHRQLSHTYAKLQKVDRSEVETELTFLGLLIMENRLKPESTPSISELHRANIRTVMVTGDNMLTAVSVAQECGIIGQGQKVMLVTANEVDGEQVVEFHVGNQSLEKLCTSTSIDIEGEADNFCFVLTGRAWKVVRRKYPAILEQIVVKGAVFARMAPEQKAQLVEEMQALGYYVAMCGDGANDCGALKVAHTGVSLSEAEASVASPFTSKRANIQCVAQLVKEGRAALVTSFGVFKFIAGYSLTQFTSVLLLYYIGANLTDFEFLYIDLVVITSLSITFPFTPAAEILYHRSPPVKLASLFPILILVLNFIVMAAVQIGAMFLVMRQAWFVKYVPNEDEDYTSYENMAVFNVSCFQYTILAVMFAQGAPYRKSIYYNTPFLVNVILCVLLALWLIVYPTDPVAEFFEIRLTPTIEFRLYFILFGVGNLVVCMLLEKLITGNEAVRIKTEKSCRFGFGRGAVYERVEEELSLPTHRPAVKSTKETFSEVLHREMSTIE